MRPSSTRCSGQASLEYVGLLALVAIVLAGAASVAGIVPLHAAIVASLRHGICIVTGGICTSADATAAGLQPCVVASHENAERVHGATALLVERGDGLLIERRSDGSVRVWFHDGNRLGGAVGFGVQTSIGVELGGSLSGGGQVNHGRAYDFGSWRSAQRFLGRHARHETLAGEVKNALRSLIGRRAKLPPPDATWWEGGAWGDAELSASLGPDAANGPQARARTRLGAVFGRRREGVETTWYADLSGDATAQLELLPAAAAVQGAARTSLELTKRAGVPVRASLRLGGRAGTQVSLGGQLRSPPLAAGAARAAARGGAGRYAGGAAEFERSVTLDLTDPSNRRAWDAVGDSLLGLVEAPGDWPARARAFAQHLREHGTTELATYARSSAHHEVSADVAAIVQLGAGYEREDAVRRLTGAWAALPERGIAERVDCLQAALPA